MINKQGILLEAARIYEVHATIFDADFTTDYLTDLAFYPPNIVTFNFLSKYKWQLEVFDKPRYSFWRWICQNDGLSKYGLHKENNFKSYFRFQKIKI